LVGVAAEPLRHDIDFDSFMQIGKSSARLLIAARYCAEIAFLRAEWSNYLYDDQLPDN